MFKITEQDITKEYIENHKYEYLGTKDKKIIKCYLNDILISEAMISMPSEYTVSEIIKNNLHYLIEDNDKIEISIFHKKFDNIIYLDLIQSSNKNKGGATEIINYIKNKYKSFWLYSVIDAEQFWEDKIKMEEQIEHVYYLLTSA